MITIKYDKKFKKDVSRDKSSGKHKPKDFETLKNVMDKLIDGKELDEKYLDHKLIGNWFGYNECHIKPNWILIYKRDEVSIKFARIGTHQQVFKNF